jgi:hypothetical protein
MVYHAGGCSCQLQLLAVDAFKGYRFPYLFLADDLWLLGHHVALIVDVNCLYHNLQILLFRCSLVFKNYCFVGAKIIRSYY